MFTASIVISLGMVILAQTAPISGPGGFVSSGQPGTFHAAYLSFAFVLCHHNLQLSVPIAYCFPGHLLLLSGHTECVVVLPLCAV